MKVDYGDNSGDDGDTASSLQSANQEDVEEDSVEEMEDSVEGELEDTLRDEMRDEEPQQMEKLDSVSGFLKQRKLGLPRLVRTISHDPTKVKAGQWF